MIKLLLLYTLSAIGEYHILNIIFLNKQEQLVGNSVLFEGNLVIVSVQEIVKYNAVAESTNSIVSIYIHT